MINEVPLVSVCVVTYNQERYIGKCLQSIIDQETDFNFEIVVSDDCSTDQTADILKEYENKYPSKIRLLQNENNIGAFENYKKVHLEAKGRYVCHVDGDDWIRPAKLKKQLEFLIANHNVILVAHKMAVWLGDEIAGYTKEAPPKISVEMLLEKHPIFLNSSIMYERSKMQDIFAVENKFIDFYVYAHAINRGDIGFINEILGDYRSSVGISSVNNLMNFVNDALDVISSKYGESSYVRRCRSRHYLSYAYSDLMKNNLKTLYSNIDNAIMSDAKWLTPRVFKFLCNFPILFKGLIGLRRVFFS